MKKTLCILLVIATLVLGVFSLAACNKEDVIVSSGEYIADVTALVSAPDADSLLSSDDLAKIEKAMDDTLDETEKQAALKDAVAVLYKSANDSRINHNGVSLMVQRSLGGSEQGRVYMNGFTLQNGKNWYYQLPAQAAEGDVAGFEIIAKMMAPIAGNLQIAYTTGDDSYDYFYIMGSTTQIDCSSNVFPYASYVIPEGETATHYDSFEAYQADRNCRYSQLELNNMGVLESLDLLKDCSIEHNEEGYYSVKFSIDCENATDEQLTEFQKYSKLDLDIGTFPIDNTVNGWNAELEVWDNGYVRSFRSYEVWDMVVTVIGMPFPVASTPSNEFVYVWNADEILKVVAQDEGASSVLNANLIASEEDKIQACIDYYISKAQNETVFIFDFFTLFIVLAACIVGAIIIVAIVLAILFKKGKLPKLQAAIERDKARRKAIVEQNKEDKAHKKEIKEEKKAHKHHNDDAQDADNQETIVIPSDNDQE